MRVKTETTTVYQFSELSDRAKETARDWYRGCIEVHDWSEHTIEDAVRMGEILGITIGTHSVRLMGGGTRQDPDVSFDLDRGSYVAFPGRYSYAKGASKAIRAEAPQDTDLHSIADDLQSAQRTAFYSLAAVWDTSTRGQSMDIDVERNDGRGEITPAQIDAVQSAIEAFAEWILSNLRRELEWQYSAECIDENIEANEYEFDEDGNRS